MAPRGRGLALCAADDHQRQSALADADTALHRHQRPSNHAHAHKLLLLLLLLLLPTGLAAQESYGLGDGETSEMGGGGLGPNDGIGIFLPAPSPTRTPKCDRVWVSPSAVGVSAVGGGVTTGKNGTFRAPTLQNPDAHSAQCVYTFVAGPGERAEVSFTSFRMRGSPPECNHEYLDLYMEVREGNAGDLIHSPFGGRYCGIIPPRKRISLYRNLALGFYTDFNTTSEDAFTGRYAFIPDDEYAVGTPIPRTTCSFKIVSQAKKTGPLKSPTYPGVYPKDLACSYTFIGSPDQRIRLEFRDFDLFYGGAHCPFDFVKIFDGPDQESPLIGTYCGQQRNLVLYSSESTLLVTFTTLPRTTNTQNRGFHGIYEFSESFVKLDFIVKNAGEHIRGTECDQKILSRKMSSGLVYSPNYPYPYLPKIVCKYFIYGLQDMQHLERVRIRFDKFDVPAKDQNCTDAFLKLYLRGQEEQQAFDKPDREFCGQKVPSSVVSDGPRLVLIFSSGEAQGSGFKGNYTFETEYRVPGTAAPDGSCTFSYRSSSRKRGDFNSPRFPANYPSSTNCTYNFLPSPNEQVRVVFDHFKVRADHINDSVGAYGAEMCQEDWLELWNVYREGSQRLLGRYCGPTAPGPVESNRGATGLKVVLHSDDEAVYSGFKARYMFLVAKSVFGEPVWPDCGRNISGQPSGVLMSPNWPSNYEGPAKGSGTSTCHWYISARARHRILLIFDSFAVEGDPVARGCPAAAVRVWSDPDRPPVELCGESLMPHQIQYLSVSNHMRVTFIAAEKAVGAEGFRAVWTEVRDGPGCDAFLCHRSGFCIDDHLRCDQMPNCGLGDRSDEANCGGDSGLNTLLMLGLSLGVVAVVLLGLAVWCQRQRRRRRRRHPVVGGGPALHLPPPSRLRPPPPAPPHVCDHTGARFANVDSV